MKSSTSRLLISGEGAFYAPSMKQKLNTKSLIEAELVGINGMMHQVLCTKYFLEEQGYVMKDSIVYQDKQRVLKLEKNGKGSSSK
eukprot:2311384-Ditylum_brightwellii.AAC.1